MICSNPSLWRQLWSVVKERYPFKADVIYHSGKWAAMEKGIQYLREVAVLEVIYGDLDDQQSSIDPDEAQCTQPMWQMFVWRTVCNCIGITGLKR